MKPLVTQSKTTLVLRWSGRVIAVLAVLFWGSFFVAHTIEWFVEPLPQTPPPAVWLWHGLHLLMLLGLLALWRWEVAGSVLAIACALAFFLKAGGTNFLLFFGATSVPALLVLASHWRTHRAQQPGHAASQ